MSWCDKLASTPTVGLQFDAHFSSVSSVLDLLSPILNRLTDESHQKQKFTLDKQDTFSAEFVTEDGFKYSVSPFAIAVAFVHRLKLKNQSGAYPTVEMVSKPRPFTDLLPEVCERVLEVEALLNQSRERQVRRLGIVTTTLVDSDQAPPGILRFIEIVGAPWQQDIEAYSFQIVSKLRQESNHTDRCIHQITRPEDQDELTTLVFDWQRTFTKPIVAPSRERLTELLSVARKDSVRYFEELAEGNRFCVDIYSKQD